MQNLRERTQAYAAHLGMKPTKSLGQHFLVNEAVLKKIIGTAGDINGVPVLEIGPGLGVLTEQLVQAGAHITAVELDRTCAAFLQKQFSTVPAVRVVQDDIFRWFSLHREEFIEGKYHIVANLPYNIASHVIRRFLEEPPRPHRITVLVQKEVAERIVAEPGSTSVLSIMAQSQSSPKLVATIPPGDFWPAPQIDSALVAFEDITWKFPGVSQRDFFRIVKVGFSARRKKLVNNLAGGLHLDVQKVRQVMSSVHIGENARAQELTLEQWAEIVGALK